MIKFTPMVSIIIINWNGQEVLKNCLESLVKINYPKWELILVDNGSTDGSENLPLEYPRLKNCQIIKNNSNLGFASANNQGVKVAKGQYILLLNNDTKVEVDFLSKLVERVQKEPELGVIQPKICLMDKPGFLDNTGSFLTRIGFLHHTGFLEKDTAKFNKEKYIFSAKGACMLIRSDIIKKIGLFDDDFFSYFEESDFCWRVWLLGYKILYYPQSIIYHKVGFTIKRLNVVEINYHYYKNRICSLCKNLDFKNLFFIFIPHLIISFGIALAFCLKLRFKNSFMIIKAILWNIINISSTFTKRKKIQINRKVKDETLFKELSFPINWQKYWGDFKRVEQDLKT